MLRSQGSLRECVSSGESKIRVLNSGYIFLSRITARRIIFRQVSLTGIVFLGIVIPPPVISNGPSLKKAIIDHVTIINIQINNNQHAKLFTQEESLS